MAKRKIQIGDDLSGKTLFISIPDDLYWFLDPSIPSYDSMGAGTDILQTNTGGVITYSRGAGVTSAAWEDLSVVQDDFIKWIYSEWGWNVDTNISKVTLPDNFGIVTNLVDTTIWDYIEVNIPDPFTNIYIGNHQVQWIYKGNHLFSNVIAGSRYIELKEFNLKNFGALSFESGQTWRQWVDQGKYWDPSIDFQVHDGSWPYISYKTVEGYTVSLATDSSDVKPDDLIIEGETYYGMLACLSEDTLIKTINGLSPISQLSIGDKLSEDNQVIDVITHIRNGYYVLKFNDGIEIKASNDHRFINDNIAILAQDLKIGELGLVSKEYVEDKQTLYEIKTTTNQYELFNGIICECEEI